MGQLSALINAHIVLGVDDRFPLPPVRDELASVDRTEVDAGRAFGEVEPGLRLPAAPVVAVR